MIEPLKLKDMYSDEFEKQVNSDMNAPIAHLERELITIRSGRAHPAMVEDLKIICYGGSQMSLKELAAISAPEPRMILIQPWDASVLPEIEKAIMASPLGVTPTSEGNLVRIQLPEVSGQRREELIKALGKKLEDCKERIRIIRGEFRNVVKDAERQSIISEDFSLSLQEILQKVTNKFTQTATQMCEKKSQEIRSV